MFDHVQIKVADLARNCEFYGAVLGNLGYGVVLEFEGVVVGFGSDPHSMLEIRQADANAVLSASVHVAFRVGSQDAVRAFHDAALALGGRDNGGPGLRPEYEPGYFAAFLIDPDGHNLEAVFSRPA